MCQLAFSASASGRSAGHRVDARSEATLNLRTPPILVLAVFHRSIAGQAPRRALADLLPSDARIIETANVPVRAAKARVLVLWMKAPRRVISAWDSAADFLYGDHWFGPTFLSLIDPSSARLINTVRIRPNRETPDDEGGFAIPFFTYNGFYYVPHPDRGRRGKPLLLRLQDLTGEGVAGQFVLFDHVASGIAAGSVLGYSSRSDTAVQYPVELTQNKFNPVVQLWAVQAFDRKPLRAGYWKFTWEARHGEMEWIDEEVHFDAGRQLLWRERLHGPIPAMHRFTVNWINVAHDFFGKLAECRSIGWNRDPVAARSHRRDIAEQSPQQGWYRPSTDIKSRWHLRFRLTTAGTITELISRRIPAFAAALQAELTIWCGATRSSDSSDGPKRR